MLSVRDLAVRGRLEPTSFAVEAGEVLAVIGPSGSGKTTLVQALAGILPAEGSVEVDGASISGLPPHRRPTRLVSQEPALFPDLSLWDNVAFALDDARQRDWRRADVVNAALADMNVIDVAHRLPHEVSGGQRQKAAVARALAGKPHVLLVDEPLAHVDVELRRDLQADIRRSARRHGTATVYVTHDIDEAFAVGDRVLMLDAGHALQCDTPEALYTRPSVPRVASFLGIPNVLAARVDAGVVRIHAFTATPHGRHFDGEATASITPESIRLAPAHDSAPAARTGQILRAVFLRSHVRYEVETTAGTLVADVPTSHVRFREGDRVVVTLTDAYVFGGEAQ